jgi:NDP-sugar pyrophosphorylase family protein
MYTIKDLYDLTKTGAGAYLAQYDYPWEALQGIGQFTREYGQSLSAKYKQIAEGVWVHESAKIAPSACINGPCVIEAGAEIRHGAYIRGNAIIGEGAVVGNSVEIKNAILFDGAQVPHFNYVGDSILGYRAHLGAGAITSNVKSDKTPVCVRDGETVIETGLKKMGAMLGDFVEVGCNSVLNPGTVVGRYARIYPLSSVRGTVAERCIYKSQGEIAKQKER